MNGCSCDGVINGMLICSWVGRKQPGILLAHQHSHVAFGSLGQVGQYLTWYVSTACSVVHLDSFPFHAYTYTWSPLPPPELPYWGLGSWRHEGCIEIQKHIIYIIIYIIIYMYMGQAFHHVSPFSNCCSPTNTLGTLLHLLAFPARISHGWSWSSTNCHRTDPTWHHRILSHYNYNVL